MAAGAVMLIASFLDFSGDTSSWGSGAFPIVTLIAIYGIVVAGVLALGRFANVNLPDRVGTFTWEQVYLFLAAFAVLMSIGWLISGIDDKGIGLGRGVAGGIGTGAGARKPASESHPGAPPSPDPIRRRETPGD